MTRPAWQRAAAPGLLALALAGGACADRAARVGVEPPRPALWRLADEDSTVWLFGSVHMLPPDLAWRTAALDRALGAADVLYFETPTGPEAAAEVGAVVAGQGERAGAPALSRRLAAPDAERLARVAKSLNLDATRLDRTEPWLAALNLSIAFVVAQGHALDAGVEQVLDGEAARRGLERRYFETPRLQLGMLANLPEADQLAFLAATLRQIEEDGDLVTAMDEAWVRGDLEALEAMLMDQLGEAGPAVYDALLKTRNTRWAEEIDRFMDGSGAALVVVGAAHLVGPDSVQSVLAVNHGRVAERAP